MIVCKCIEKFRDKNGNIKGYRLQDQQGKCLDVKPDQLKMAIFSKQLDVVNLKLTTDSRLIDREENNKTSLQKAFMPSSNEELLEQLFDILSKHINEDFDSRKGMEWKWKYCETVEALRLFDMLGVKIEKVETPAKQYIGWLNLGARFYYGASKIDFFNDTAIWVAPTLKNKMGHCIFPSSIAELNYIVELLKSKKNTECISYGQIHKLCTKAMLSTIMTESKLKDYLICFDWDDFEDDMIYCVPIGLRNKVINSDGFESEKVPITIFLGSGAMSTCEDTYTIVVTDLEYEKRKEILVNIYNGNLNQTYKEIKKAMKAIIEDM